MNNFLKYKGILGEDLKVSPNIIPSDVTDLLEYIQLFIRAKDEVNKEICKLVYSWIIEDIIEKMLTDIDYAVIEARLSEIGSQVIFTSEIERKELEARLSEIGSQVILTSEIEYTELEARLRIDEQ